MSVSRVKELFYDATNSKVLIGSGDDEYLQGKLREAHSLAVSLQDQVWQYIPAYRLSHLLFREAKIESDFAEIMELLEHAEKSDSNYISLNSSLLRFAAMHRLHLLGANVPKEAQMKCAESIVEKISTVSNQDKHLEAWHKPVQSDYFNIFEYLIYATAFDYQPLVGVGRDERNTLFPHFNNDVWTIIGANGPVDRFSYNFEDGMLELNRLCKDKSLTGYFVLGDPHETRLWNFDRDHKDNFEEVQLLHLILSASNLGIQAKNLAEVWRGLTDPADSAKKGRKSIEKFLGGDVFSRDTRGNRWSISEGVQIYGLVNRRHRNQI